MAKHPSVWAVLAAAGAALGAATVGRAQEAQGEPRPNIILLLADDMGFGDPHCYNAASKIPTPHMDRLAREGRRFLDAHATASVCSPTRYSILTGRYAWRSRLKLGVLRPWDPALIEPGRLTLPAMLKARGYTTAAFGKWHLGWTWSTFNNQAPRPQANEDYRAKIDFSKPISDGPTARGFDDFFGMVGNVVSDSCLIDKDRPVFTGRGPAPELAGVPRSLLENWQDRNTLPMLTERAVWYLEQRAKEKAQRPFFMYVAFTAPHTPLLPHGPFRGKTGHGDCCDFVHQLDASIGKVLDALDRRALTKRTLVFLTSDNGSPGFADEGAPTGSIIAKYGHYPNGPWRGMKGDIHEGGHRVPFIARWPGHIPPNTTCRETSCLVDLMATCAAAVGAKLPGNAAEDSHNLLPALLGKPLERPIREGTVHHALIGMFAIRQGDWKLILGRGSGGFTLPQRIKPKPDEPAGQLYNLAQDPGETRDFYLQRPAIVKRLTTLLERYQCAGRSAPR
jgi:arylsulfatase A-like enzyme